MTRTLGSSRRPRPSASSRRPTLSSPPTTYVPSAPAREAQAGLWLTRSSLCLQGYNLGHHRIPSNKFLLYDHATRIPGVIHGPGILPGEYPVTGTNVDCKHSHSLAVGQAAPQRRRCCDRRADMAGDGGDSDATDDGRPVDPPAADPGECRAPAGRADAATNPEGPRRLSPLAQGTVPSVSHS